MNDAALLRQALPYIVRYHGSTVVVKVGGAIAEDPERLRTLCADLSLLQRTGIRVVVVHGGGPQATRLSERLGLQPELVEGRRVTDDDTLDVVKMVFGGKINTEFLSALRAHGTPAVGISGVDGGLLQAVRRPPRTVRDPDTGDEREVDFGHVGDLTGVEVRLPRVLLGQDFIPVVCSMAADAEGRVLNVNADTVAGALAAALEADRLFSLTDVPGLLDDPDDPKTLVPSVTVSEARARLDDGRIRGGMAPKIQTLVEAVEQGVGAATILDGTAEAALLTEIFTDRGAGTQVVPDGAGDAGGGGAGGSR